MKIGFYLTESGYLASIVPAVMDDIAGILSGAPQGAAVTIVERETVPASWRDAWGLLGGAVVIDPLRAVLVAQERIRQWRVDEFSKNDIAIQNALADGDAQALEVAKTRRDYLRDLPQQCEGKNLAELELLLNECGKL